MMMVMDMHKNFHAAKIKEKRFQQNFFSINPFAQQLIYTGNISPNGRNNGHSQYYTMPAATTDFFYQPYETM